MKILLCVLLCLFSCSIQLHSIGNMLFGCIRNCRPMSSRNRNPYQFYHSSDRWFVQELDHLDHYNEKTWKQRYRVIDKHYKSEQNSTIFLYVGGENVEDIHIGSWLHYAKHFKALCFYVEHRYYGKSRPTKDLSTENLIYLSSKQALADLVKFIVDIPNVYEKHKIPNTAKWVVFGGSYSGTLAVWLRNTYPDLVYAAVASSAPLVATLDFKEYYKDVESTLASFNPECVSQIQKATEDIKVLLKTTEGQNEIRKKFKICVQKGDNNINANELLKLLRSHFSRLVTNGYYGQTTISFETLCNKMAENSNRSAVDRLANVNEFMMTLKVWDCTPLSYSYYEEHKAKLSYGEESYRQWQYQSCTELGLFQTSSKNDSIFRIDDPIDNYVGECNRLFSIAKNIEEMSAIIEKTNEAYGGLDVQENRIIYVNGSQDPWHFLGITQTKIKDTVSIYIHGAAHCADFKYPLETDLPLINNARYQTMQYLDTWLKGYKYTENVVIELKNDIIKNIDV